MLTSVLKAYITAKIIIQFVPLGMYPPKEQKLFYFFHMNP